MSPSAEAGRAAAGDLPALRLAGRRLAVGVGTVQRAEADASNVSSEIWSKLFARFGAEVVEVDSAIASANLLTRSAGGSPGPSGRKKGVGTGVSNDAAPGYLDAMRLWWDELEPEDEERIHDFARQVRDERRESRKAKAG